MAETGSTNEDVRALARDGAAEGLWLRAGRQTSGRGRVGRPWVGDDGNVYASTLVRLQPNDPPPATLALVAAVAVHQALSAFVGREALRIKWPNDIMAGAAKCCGMLLEREGDAIIVGIGVNVLSGPDLADRPTASLAALGAVGCDAEAVTREIAAAFAVELRRWRTYGVAPVARAWMERAHVPGTALAVRFPDGSMATGTFEGLDEDGALLLREPEGLRRRVHAGDIFLI